MDTADKSPASPSPQAQVMGVVIGITQGRCLVAAAELGLADALAGGPLSVEAIAAKVNADADNLFRLMRALETIGVFKQVSPRVFENTPMSDCIRKDGPGSQWVFLQMWAPGWGYWEGYGEMLQTVRTGKTTLFDTWGYDLWEHYRRHPEQWTVFNEAMRSMTTPMTSTVTAAYDWSRFAVIADIGGGIGTQLVDILDAHPECRGVLFDQPEVVSTAIEHDRVERVGGDFFKEIPVKADAYIFRNIIHDWNDEKSVSILRTLRKATKPHARVMLLEWVIPDTSDFHLGKLSDMVMMTGVSGRERTRGEFDRLFTNAGFVLEDIVPTKSMFSIVVGRPAV
jgi:O-methyltransferase/methyltransferase family protein